MKKQILTWIVLLSALMGCKINKKAAMPIENFMMDEVLVQAKPAKPSVYQPAPRKYADLIHTKLHLSFDYQNQWVLGSAHLWIKPITQKQENIALDAQGFTFLRVAQIKNKDTLVLNYISDGKKVLIYLGFWLNPNDTVQIWIDYIAKPNELKGEGGAAITDSRGLYFINPLGTDPNKPRQIWTQGETEYNSCWFPTIDLPSEKHTQDIYLTVDSSDVTLSNGLLVSSKKIKNGKRMDHWQQLKPHAPYLTMIAVGNFSITKDVWRGKEVSYYVEPAYAPYAKLIFGKTPQMLEAFSQITGVPYPWDKFSQVVCRDFVSGAMENTTAVVHYENVQHNANEHLDNTHEDIIAHELFHHWFGDLVTSKTWSQLPLNESFATYGEYLYNEYTYGKTYADKVFSKNLSAYLRNTHKYFVSPVRRFYANPDDMFDVVSYQKGSWILHHLRSYVGDSAFFKGMKLYLLNNAYQSTDIDHLRHAMEETSGRDLHVFFKQWWEGIGHPLLLAQLQFNAKDNQWYVSIKQQQDSAFGLFTIETHLSYLLEEPNKEGLRLVTVPIRIQNKSELIPITFHTGENSPPRIASFWLDAYGNLPAELVEVKLPSANLLQLKNAPSYQVKMAALQNLSYVKYEEDKSILLDAVRYCLSSKEPFYQQAGMNLFGFYDSLFYPFEQEIIALANSSPEAYIREDASYWVGSISKWALAEPIVLAGLNDSSYQVVSTCLQALFESEPDQGILACEKLEQVPSASIQKRIAWIYAAQVTGGKNNYFKSVLGKFGFSRNSILSAYGKYLGAQNVTELSEGLLILTRYFETNSDRDKAKQMQSVLQEISDRSEHAVSELPTYKQLKNLVTQELK
ncbi:MAG: M1 family metallopeptidase [Bacteroidota bacterium]|nr:M1 family metallopeptidase [Bacteroidota bacterium]